MGKWFCRQPDVTAFFRLFFFPPRDVCRRLVVMSIIIWVGGIKKGIINFDYCSHTAGFFPSSFRAGRAAVRMTVAIFQRVVFSIFAVVGPAGALKRIDWFTPGHYFSINIRGKLAWGFVSARKTTCHPAQRSRFVENLFVAAWENFCWICFSRAFELRVSASVWFEFLLSFLSSLIFIYWTH